MNLVGFTTEIGGGSIGECILKEWILVWNFQIFGKSSISSQFAEQVGNSKNAI
jgi:hypothetical protein